MIIMPFEHLKSNNTTRVFPCINEKKYGFNFNRGGDSYVCNISALTFFFFFQIYVLFLEHQMFRIDCHMVELSWWLCLHIISCDLYKY